MAWNRKEAIRSFWKPVSMLEVPQYTRFERDCDTGINAQFGSVSITLVLYTFTAFKAIVVATISCITLCSYEYYNIYINTFKHQSQIIYISLFLCAF